MGPYGGSAAASRMGLDSAFRADTTPSLVAIVHYLESSGDRCLDLCTGHFDMVNPSLAWNT